MLPPECAFILALMMVKKIYFNNKPLFVVSEITREVEAYLHHDDAVFIDEFNIHTVKAMIHEMELPRIHAGVFLHNDVDAVLKAFKKKLFLVQAAGGLVYTDDHELLLIFRRGKWDLPKGKVDEGESIEACAVREIKEETGIDISRNEGPLCTTFHTYHQFGKHILKESHWFLMKAEKSAFIPQAEEDIEKCEWVAVDRLAPYMENTHASILDVVKAGVKQLHEVKNV
jgi:8-oxo-dGTP pyrophosphatase MutT (NUDIX family)